MKYIAVIDTDDYKDFKFFEDANGKYLVARDAGAENNEWIALYFTECEQEPKWIPVSERLPEDRRTVLVTAYWHETYQVMEASYYGDGLWWCVPFNNCGEHMQQLKPKAWMPLPKPFEPQKRNDKK